MVKYPNTRSHIRIVIPAAQRFIGLSTKVSARILQSSIMFCGVNLITCNIQQQHEELEQQNKRNRSQKMPSRRAQKTAIQQRNLNPVLDLEMSI